jgi:RNA polymerase sigma-70 factor (ECF subfamily)
MDLPTATADLDSQYLRRARCGDHAAFASLYLRHASAVYTLCVRLVRDHHHAEDLTQETFLRALAAAGDFRGGAPLAPWLKRIAANLAIDWRRTRRIDPPGESLDDDGSADTTPGTAIDLSALLERLPMHVRTVLWLALVEGWTHRELAERFGRSESWSKTVLARATARLQKEHTP